MNGIGRLLVPGMVLGIAAAAGSAGTAAAEDFYSGKRIRLVVGTGAGGGYDGYARLFASHADRHIPGKPTIIVQNKPGASGINAVNELYLSAPKDGTYLATFNNAMPLYQILGSRGIKFKVQDLNFIGAMSKSNSVVVAWHTSGVKTLEDAKKKSIVMGATGSSGTMAVYPTFLNNVLGTKFKVVTGYTGGATVNLAMERGEVQGRGSNPLASWKATNPDWLRDGKINILVQLGPAPDPEMPKGVPLLLDLARDDAQRRLFRLFTANIATERPFALPPGVPAERVALMRRVFTETVRDGAFVAEAKARNWDLTPSTGDEVQRIVEDIVTAPAPLIARLRAAVRGEMGKCEEVSAAEHCRPKKKSKKAKKEG